MQVNNLEVYVPVCVCVYALFAVCRVINLINHFVVVDVVAAAAAVAIGARLCCAALIDYEIKLATHTN